MARLRWARAGSCDNRNEHQTFTLQRSTAGSASSALVTSGENPTRRRTTVRGSTRARMISSAADLMYVRGVNAVTLDDVRAATGTSKSQLYKHFPPANPNWSARY